MLPRNGGGQGKCRRLKNHERYEKEFLLDRTFKVLKTYTVQSRRLLVAAVIVTSGGSVNWLYELLRLLLSLLLLPLRHLSQRDEK